ncbi:protein kinase [bacterium]|nr:protein kinase [bacterium]
MASYSDILFGKIVVKNGLAPLATVQECLQIQEASRARGIVLSLPEVLVARAVITEEQARLASRAQALTQLQRAESIYAKIVHERGLVAFPVLQECFSVQKERRFTVRIGQILLERRLLSPEQNAEITEEQIFRLGDETRHQEEAGLGGSTPLQEDSKVQRLQQEQPRLTDLNASTFRNARAFATEPPAQEVGERTIPFDRVLPIAPEGRASSPPSEAGERTIPFDRVLPIAPEARPTAPPPEDTGTRTISFDRVLPLPAPSASREKAQQRAEPPRPAPAKANGVPRVTMELDVPQALPGMTPAAVPVEEIESWSGTAPSAPARAVPADGEAGLIGKTISSRYRILEKVGEGGMGTVYRAEHCLMEKIVAFKVLHPHLIANKTSLERFRREVRAASKFQHKNVVQIYDAGEGEGGIFYMAMEFIEGVGLEQILKGGALRLERTLLLLRQMLRAIGEAHKKGIVHRDLKSENIMITSGKDGEEQVKVMDFGIAKVLGPDGEASQESQGDDQARMYKTMEGVITGTPQYMSPEQAEGKKVDHRSDLYSLGIIVFEMLTGELPFKSETAMGYLGKHIIEEPPRPSTVRTDLEIPPRLEGIVMRLLEKDPEKRYQTADDIFRDLETNVTKEFLEVRPGMLSGEEVAPKTPSRGKLAVPPTKERPSAKIAEETARSAKEKPEKAREKPPREKPAKPEKDASPPSEKKRLLAKKDKDAREAAKPAREATPSPPSPAPARPQAPGMPKALLLTLAGALLVIVLGLAAALALRTPSDGAVRAAIREIEDLRKANKIGEALLRTKVALAASPGEPRLAALERDLEGRASPEELTRAEVAKLVSLAEKARAAGDRASLERAVELLERAEKLAPDDTEVQGKLRAAQAELKRVSDAGPRDPSAGPRAG